MKELNDRELELVAGGSGGTQDMETRKETFAAYWEQKKKKDRRSPLWRLVMDD